jgi:cardiolipin synthase
MLMTGRDFGRFHATRRFRPFSCSGEHVALLGVKTGSASLVGRQPSESRRWLKPRVPHDQLHRLAPAPAPSRLDSTDLWDRVRRLLRAWGLWLVVAAVLLWANLWVGALLAGALAFILYHTTPSSHPAIYAMEPDFDAESDEFRTTIAGVTGMPWVAGNRVEVFQNGDNFYPAMLEAIDIAQHSVTMEQYIFWDSAVGRRFAEAFAEKACQGVKVKLLVDAIGSATVGEPILRILEAGGCQLAWFRPIHWYTLDRANQRNHRKSLMVDGRVAFTGGAGLADHWIGSGACPVEWRDTMVSVEGPAVLAQQAGFAQNWLAATGEILSGRDFFPPPRIAGDVEVQSILSSPSGGASAAGTMHLVAVQSARKYLYIANPYFIPDARVKHMLANACRRGVEVKLMVAGGFNDTWWARQNSLRHYRQLLEAGIQVFEYQPCMLHQKTMLVDGAWATVGTANFDNRSFALNEETNICFHDPALVENLRVTFDADLTRCKPIDLAEWRTRGLWQRTKERFASLIEDQV